MRNHEHVPGKNRHRIGEAHQRFARDPCDEHELHQRIAVADQHFQPRIAERAARIGRPARVVRSEPGEHQRAGIDEHMARVGEQRERARNESADRLGDQHEQRQRERQQQPVLAPRRCRVIVVRVVFVVVVGEAQ